MYYCYDNTNTDIYEDDKVLDITRSFVSQLINEHGHIFVKEMKEFEHISPCILYMWTLGLMKGDLRPSLVVRCISHNKNLNFFFNTNNTFHNANTMQTGANKKNHNVT